MKKTLFNIDSQEKQRILEMHQNATNRLYLNEQEVTKQIPTPKPVDNSNLKISYRILEKSIWPLIQNSIAIPGIANNKPNGIISWTYPLGVNEITQVYTNNILDTKKLSEYDIKFMERLDIALKDSKWLTERVNESNTLIERNKNQISQFQTFIMNNIEDKSLVKDNGSGGQFNDGQFGVITLIAFIKYKMQTLNNLDSRYLKSSNLI
jgi:hypothetical protein